MAEGVLWKESLWGWFDATDFLCCKHVCSAGEPCWAAFPVGIIALGERVRKLTSIEPLQLELHSFAKFVGVSRGGTSGIKMAQAEPSSPQNSFVFVM